jgi:hypothetical protein
MKATFYLLQQEQQKRIFASHRRQVSAFAVLLDLFPQPMFQQQKATQLQ